MMGDRGRVWQVESEEEEERLSEEEEVESKVSELHIWKPQL